MCILHTKIMYNSINDTTGYKNKKSYASWLYRPDITKRGAYGVIVLPNEELMKRKVHTFHGFISIFCFQIEHLVAIHAYHCFLSCDFPFTVENRLFKLIKLSEPIIALKKFAMKNPS